MTRPWLQLHTRDVLDCKELARCKPDERFVLLALMCLAHEGNPYGFLSDDVGALTEDYMAARCVVPVVLFRRAVSSLIQNTRLRKTDDGILFVPRMVRDEDIRQRRAEGGKQSASNPKVPRAKDTLNEPSKDGMQGYPSGGPSAPNEGYLGPRAHTDTRSDSDSSVCFPGVSESGENEKPKERLPPRNPSLTTQVTDPQWFEFMAKWQETGGTEASVCDWDKALKCWRGKDLPERLEASIGLTKDHVGKENCLPQNYLANRIYRRGVRKTTTTSSRRDDELRRILEAQS